MKKTIGTLMVAASALAFSASANALEFTPYVGVDYNYTDVASHSAHFNSGSLNVGTNYNKYFGTELLYQYSTEDKKAGEKTRIEGYGLDLYGYLPLGCDQTFSLLGTAGIAEYKVTSKYDGEKDKDHGYGYRLGAGAMYNINENVSVHALARYVFTDKIEGIDHLMEYTLGARYNF